MDIERTMEFILKQQAKAQGEMAAIRKLIKAGMQMIVHNEELIKQLAEAQRELAAAQRVTEAKLQGFIDSLRRSGNGHRRKN